MRKSNLTFLLSFVLFAFNSCSKDSVTTTNPTSSFVKYKVNDVLQDNTPILSSLCTIDTNNLQCTGVGPEYGISIFAIVPQTTGTYDLKSAGLKGVITITKGGSTGIYYQIEKTKLKSKGTLTITKVKSIGGGKFAANGTFSGIVENNAGETVTLTEGEFFDIRTN